MGGTHHAFSFNGNNGHLLENVRPVASLTYLPVVFLNEGRNSVRLGGHVSGESAQIIELRLQAIAHGLGFDKLLQCVLGNNKALIFLWLVCTKCETASVCKRNIRLNKLVSRRAKIF